MGGSSRKATLIEGHSEPPFGRLVDLFDRMFRSPRNGGGALAVYRAGRPVVDVWTGWADSRGRRPWREDTVAMSFSTTKGVTSTVLHRLVDRGLLEMDRPVAAYWPAFGANGKVDVTVRQIMCHMAGLHDVRRLVRSADELLDHDHMIESLAAARPRPRPGVAPGYHGLTYGWLAAGIARAVTGLDMAELFQREIAEPLQLDGFWLGAPEGERDRVAELFPRMPGVVGRLGEQALRLRATRGLAQALIVDGFDDIVHDDARILPAQLPAANGVFTARGLAKLYAALATGGAVDGVTVLDPDTLDHAGRVQTRQRDYVLGMRMRWRLGYHQAFTLRRPHPRSFGHFGYGGSGAWADPATGMSLAFVTNRLGSVTTPLADGRILRLGAAAMEIGRTMSPAGHSPTRSSIPSSTTSGVESVR